MKKVIVVKNERNMKVNEATVTDLCGQIMHIASKKSVLGAKKTQELTLKVSVKLWDIAKVSYTKLSDIIVWAFGHLKGLCARLMDAIKAFFTTLFHKEQVVAA
jgi:hypothetical protein